MNDNDLIDELREGMHAHTDHMVIPDGFADAARRTARRRSARRAATAGTPLLAAAGIATIVVTGAGSPRHATRVPTVTVDGQTHDTAYIVERVKAKLADDAQNGTVGHTVDYRTGQVAPDGSLINLGWKMNEGYEYLSPAGTEYSSQTQYWQNGTVQFTWSDTYVPGANGAETDTETVVNPASHTYSRKQYSQPTSPAGGGALDLFSTPAQVQQALQSNQVSQQGVATIDGTQAIALLVDVPSNPPQTTVLYVDAQDYQPLRLVQQVNGGGHVLHVEDWIPTTAANIADAEQDTVPAGYTQAAPAKVY
jgi:hypothetical protein